MKPISFISEHTAEYALVGDITQCLMQRFSSVIPVYFWATREGSRVGCEYMQGRPVKIVAAYARRPKVQEPGQDWLLVKINSQLFQAAALGQQLGIPVFAGVPVVTSLTSFRLGVPCCWFVLSPKCSSDGDCEFRLSVADRTTERSSGSNIMGPLSQDEIIRVVEDHARAQPWEKASLFIREINRSGTQYLYSRFVPGYRPFFLLIPAERGDCMK